MQQNGKIRAESLMQLLQEIARAVWLGNTSQMIDNVTKLAHCALESGHVDEKSLAKPPVIDSVDTGISLLCETVKHCAAGKAEFYPELYGLCTQLNRKLLNQ